MNVVYRFRIYPNKIQQELFAKTFGCVRFVYNRMLAEKKECYEKNGKNLKVTPAKYKAEFPWLKEVDSLALCNAQLHLQTAYKNFFRDPSFGFPKFKSKKNPVKSYTTNSVNGNILLKDGKLKLPKAGWIRIRQHRKIRKDACLKGASVCLEADGRYYVSLLYFCEEKPVETRNIRQAVGLDFSMKELYVDSNGKHAGYPHYFRNSEEKLAKAQRKLSHCRKGSNSYKKQQKKVARIHTHIAHQRKDYLHKVSHEIISENQVIVSENLQIKNMVKNHRLAKSISDVSWYELTRQLEYKAKWNGRKYIKIDTFYASSQLCSVCGYQNPDTKDLSVRTWICPKCGAEHDRDINAAKNILTEGLRQIA